MESFSSGGVVDDDQGRRTATKRSGKARCSGCSGQDNVVEVASVDEEGARDLVKMMIGIEGIQHKKGEGSGWLTGVGI